MRTFVRVEGISKETGKSFGGYVSAGLAVTAMRLGVPPDHPQLIETACQCEDADTRRLMAFLGELTSIRQPDIYQGEDKENYYCLYDIETFSEEYMLISDVLEIIRKTTDKFDLQFILMEIEDDEIVYEDSAQIVISKETYEKHHSDTYYPLDAWYTVEEELYGEDDFEIDDLLWDSTDVETDDYN